MIALIRESLSKGLNSLERGDLKAAGQELNYAGSLILRPDQHHPSLFQEVLLEYLTALGMLYMSDGNPSIALSFFLDVARRQSLMVERPSPLSGAMIALHCSDALYKMQRMQMAHKYSIGAVMILMSELTADGLANNFMARNLLATAHLRAGSCLENQGELREALTAYGWGMEIALIDEGIRNALESSLLRMASKIALGSPSEQRVQREEQSLISQRVGGAALDADSKPSTARRPGDVSDEPRSRLEEAAFLAKGHVQKVNASAPSDSRPPYPGLLQVTRTILGLGGGGGDSGGAMDSRERAVNDRGASRGSVRSRSLNSRGANFSSTRSSSGGRNSSRAGALSPNARIPTQTLGTPPFLKPSAHSSVGGGGIGSGVRTGIGNGKGFSPDSPPALFSPPVPLHHLPKNRPETKSSPRTGRPETRGGVGVEGSLASRLSSSPYFGRLRNSPRPGLVSVEARLHALACRPQWKTVFAMSKDKGSLAREDAALKLDRALPSASPSSSDRPPSRVEQRRHKNGGGDVSPSLDGVQVVGGLMESERELRTQHSQGDGLDEGGRQKLSPGHQTAQSFLNKYSPTSPAATPHWLVRSTFSTILESPSFFLEQGSLFDTEGGPNAGPPSLSKAGGGSTGAPPALSGSSFVEDAEAFLAKFSRERKPSN